ncbi:hypothetical protein NW755_010365 [Fusarium falciforme]|uniref:Uncharacterized protein n=1 Tax=Fusarium falciforme TaxID=195108 RepID=A0A9W8R241_9HYPO|nr:hypothetical protein NW755_010365 [Fusarium falciforme]
MARTKRVRKQSPEPEPEPPRFLSRFRRRNKKKPAPTPKDILSVPDNPQSGSPLFRLLPAEVRNQIFALALTDYEDPSPDNHYDGNTCFTRPSYFAPRRTDTTLLRTCRAVYRECRFLPFMLTEQLHWLSFDERAPPEYDVNTAVDKLHATAMEIAQQMGQEQVQIEGIRAFPQMFKLEQGELESLLRTPYMDPKRLTITIRHADWWNWEDDAPLRFEGSWISDVSDELSPSLNEICIEMETLERKKRQVDRIAKMMIERWFFKKPDGTVLVADTEGSTRQESRWRGTSRWHNKRWIRDETEEGVIDYYIVSVTFRPRHVVERNGGKISEHVSKRVETHDYDDDELSLRLPDETPMDCPEPYIYECEDFGSWCGNAYIDDWQDDEEAEGSDEGSDEGDDEGNNGESNEASDEWTDEEDDDDPANGPTQAQAQAQRSENGIVRSSGEGAERL